MQLRIRGIPTAHVEALQDGGPDAHGQPAQRRVAEGPANPCRHCLSLITPGDAKLVLAYRPFERLQPYAESGPIFLHARSCERYDAAAFPGWFAFLEPAVVRGYGHDDWIRYETGDVVPGARLEETCRAILADPQVAYVHVRSKWSCFQCRVERSAAA